jgi:tRNA U38,U39,U40 pseudouridine synthase TruA
MMEPEKPFWGIHTKKQPMKNYRHSDQNLLFSIDEHFDSRLSAAAKCYRYLRSTYDATSLRLHIELTELISEDYLRALWSKSETVSVSSVTSSLSDIDRNHVIDLSLMID